MRIAVAGLLLCAVLASAQTKTVVFREPGFPTIESEPVPEAVLKQALEPLHPVFVSLDDLLKPETLADAGLLVLPYGSAFPVEAWPAIRKHLENGGNLLSLGGRALSVPVEGKAGAFTAERPQNTYSRSLGIWHSYEAPQKDGKSFAWDEDYDYLPAIQVHARRAFVSAMDRGAGNYRAMGYLVNDSGTRVAGAITREDFWPNRGRYAGARCVFVNIDPEAGYWPSPDGITLIRTAAIYARRGATRLWVEMQNPTLAPGEVPQATVHLDRGRPGTKLEGKVTLELSDGSRVLATREADAFGESLMSNVVFPNALAPGLYTITGTYSDGGIVERYHTGVWSRDMKLLTSGSRLSVSGDYFQKDGAPFIAFGTNYFSNDIYPTGFFTGQDIAGNAWAWDRDFADMQRRGVNMVRTGTWLNRAEYLTRITGGVEERFLRSLEAFLLSAGRHNIQVIFTFFAFDPQTVRGQGEHSQQGPGSNPYTDPVAIRAEQEYIRSIAARFRDVPYLMWDFINEPSFSNPRRLWIGNTPSDDPTERRAWNAWLEKKYASAGDLARAWHVAPAEAPAFGSVPLPSREDLALARLGNQNSVRAIDYNLFAQDAFKHWVEQMMAALRETGAKQPATVGQDEGGVTNRVLNQFYGDALDFTVNHTWWRDDALLWDSLAAKRPDRPNLIGETGVQPADKADGTWRWDETHAAGLFERKMALGLAAGNAGALAWDWGRGDQFGSKRADGSARVWEEIIAGLCDFARHASPYMKTGPKPEIALVLPQSLQLSVFNNYALEAQQNAVRALYYYARGTAYAVGEYQMDMLGSPKLIVLPSPWVLTQEAWKAILARVQEGAVLLVSGRIDADEHFRPTDRTERLGLAYGHEILGLREHTVQFGGRQIHVSYGGDKITYLERGTLAGGAGFSEKTIGKGRILYFAMPLELNDNLAATGEIYRAAMDLAGIKSVYLAQNTDPGVLIAPTQLANATLYVLASETDEPQAVAFRDVRSGAEFKTTLAPGRAALVVITQDGDIAARYSIQ